MWSITHLQDDKDFVPEHKSIPCFLLWDQVLLWKNLKSAELNTILNEVIGL